jgi:hypothetical protein
MLIKQQRRRRDYLISGLVVLMSLIGGYGLLLTYTPKAIVTAEVSSSQPHRVTLQVQGEGLRYWLLGPSDAVRNTRVIGADAGFWKTKPSSEFPNYPAPVEQSISPRMVTVALTYPWVIKPDVPNVQYTTFLLDSVSLPVVSLSAPPRYLFGKKGLYSIQKGSDKEVTYPVHFQFLDQNKGVQVKERAEATVAGYSSKMLPMKSLDLEFHRPIATTSIFNENNQQKAHSLRLRNGGNDFLLAHMRDALVSELCQSTYNIVLDYQPVATFINGEFWGIQYLRERISEEYLEDKYPRLNRSQIRMGELHDGEALVISNGFDYQLGNLMDFTESTDFSQAANFDSLTHLIDIPNFIDYIIVQTFISNSDWPHNNVKAAFLDKKLHFILYDTDFAFNFPRLYRDQLNNYLGWADRIFETDAVNHNYFETMDTYVPTQINTIFQKLIKVPVFRERFIHRYRELLNTILSQSRIHYVVDQISSQLSPLMPEHINRWGYPTSVADWERNVQLINEFCAQRRSIVLDQLEKLEQRSFESD